MKFINPFENSSGFIDLGPYEIHYIRSCGSEYYDLYAIDCGSHIDFGARYGSNDSDYISGGCFDGKEMLGGAAPILMAATRYYKMKYEEEKQRGQGNE
jgi:hypothetical protein